MSERVQVILYTVVASAVLWFGVERFLGTTDEYASRLDIRNTPQDPNWDPENEIVNPSSPINSAAARRAGAEANAPLETAADDVGSRGEGEDEKEEATPERDEEAERLTVADAERADSDGDMQEDVVSVPGMSAEEAALLERIDPELLRGRPSTRALDLTLADCTLASAGAADDAAAPPRALPDFSVPVLYRHGSVAIRGASLNRIDVLVESFRRCGSATLVAEPNPEGRVDVDEDERLVRRREEELKYYLLQRRVPKEAMRFPERS